MSRQNPPASCEPGNLRAGKECADADDGDGLLGSVGSGMHINLGALGGRSAYREISLPVGAGPDPRAVDLLRTAVIKSARVGPRAYSRVYISSRGRKSNALAGTGTP
jgi:hypothetical protein